MNTFVLINACGTNTLTDDWFICKLVYKTS
uniref:Uncharacterized protein n=1 Tax=Arundo donax TaxID=35708 RepID=A0A0A8Y376_ARUDO